MSKQIDLYRRHKKARSQLDTAFAQSEHSVLVHYSCESFYERENNPRSPRVTSIAVRSLDSGQTKSFSIHLTAERLGLLDQVEARYDELERRMLDDFYNFARTKQHCTWLHWNMRDANYGFAALENRYQALGGVPFEIPEEKRIDLSRILIALYGVGYIKHPRLESLMELNSIAARDFMNGEREAEAFENGEYVALHQSTLRKVDVLANIATRAHADDLKTYASWWERKGGSVKVAVEWIKDHWLLSALMTLGAIAYKASNLISF